MPIDPTVIAVLLSAIDKDPENTALRLHLVSVLIESGRPGDMDEALKHCAIILTSQPDHTEALDYAARAAEAIGDSKRAEGYRRLHKALSADDPVTPPLPQQNTEAAPDEHFWPSDLMIKEPEPEEKRPPLAKDLSDDVEL